MEPLKLKRELSVFHLLWHLWTQESVQSFQKYHGDWSGAGPENSKYFTLYDTLWVHPCIPFQYICLGNPVDRGAWQATVHGGHKGSDTTE